MIRRLIFGVPFYAFLGGLLGAVCGFLEVAASYLVIYKDFLVGRVEGGPGGAGLAFLMYLSVSAGLLMLVGGVLVLLRKPVLGGIILIVSGVFPFRMSPLVLWLLFSLPTQQVLGHGRLQVLF